jgi:hypothetical protein
MAASRGKYTWKIWSDTGTVRIANERMTTVRELMGTKIAVQAFNVEKVWLHSKCRGKSCVCSEARKKERKSPTSCGWLRRTRFECAVSHLNVVKSTYLTQA